MGKSSLKESSPCKKERWRIVLALGACCLVSLSVSANVSTFQSVPENEFPHEEEVSQEGFKVKGQVLDNLGEPLPGVNVMVKGTMTGIITDVDGNYEIVAPYSKASLVFSYVGYQPQEISLSGKHTLNVTLVEDTKALEEVVVVGYVTQKKRLSQVLWQLLRLKILNRVQLPI